jgi:hypothetical protein
VKLSEGTKQQGLIITPKDESAVTVDELEVAQFVYLLLHNEKIRRIIDTIGKKGVLLLGRFTDGRIKVLERLREELRKRDYVPIVFNFDKPQTKDFTETVRLLAGLSKFVIADITNPKSSPLELQATVSEIMVPFQPIIEQGEKPFAMLQDLSSWMSNSFLRPAVTWRCDRRLRMQSGRDRQSSRARRHESSRRALSLVKGCPESLMAKTSKTKGFDNLKDSESYLVAGRGGATHQIADTAQRSLTTNQGVIIRQQRVWDRAARLSESDA